MTRTHPYLPNSERTVQQAMLREIGVSDIEELFQDIPEEVRLNRPLNIPGPFIEAEVCRTIGALLEGNKGVEDMPIFLGGGVWPHYVPAVVGEVVERAEFLTAYTPYQAEISQGMLQALFEYQSFICELTGMDASNSSMYDWASALGEAALMASRVTHRSRIITPHYIHPERYIVLKTMTAPINMKVEEVAQDGRTGQISMEDLEEKLDDDVAAVYVENPSFLGFLLDDLDELGETVHNTGALLIVGVDPLSLGLVRSPASYGADIVVGEGQPLGLGLNYGGPQLGIFACSGSRLLRQMPGRIIGLTSTVDGQQRAFCMVLQTREQHIRREKATSNICTNNALCAVAAAVYLSLLGPRGLRKLGETIMIRSNYAMERLRRIGVEAPIFDAVHFKEFTVRINDPPRSMKEMEEQLFHRGIHGGKLIKEEFPELGETALYCVTEIHSPEDIDQLVNAMQQILGGG